MDGQTVLTDTTDYAASVLDTRTNKEMSEIKAMMKKLADSVTAQAETVETLFTKMNEGSSISGKTIYKRKAIPGLHVRVYCKREVYLKDRNYLGLEVNKTKRYPGWKIVFTK